MQRVEGIPNINCCQGSTLLNSAYGGGDSGSLIPIDAIQEFNAQENPKAENGFRQVGVVNVGIKSGTNSIHGTAFAFGRDAAATDSADYFTGAVTPATMEQFGATAGGPDFLGNVGKPISARACPTKTGGTLYRGSAEFLEMSDGQIRIVGQLVEEITPEQFHFKPPVSAEHIWVFHTVHEG